MIRAIAILIALTAPAHADIRVIDGDTIATGGETYRLTREACHQSFDAPERDTAAGREATAFLRSLIDRAEHITLRDTGQRSFNRRVGVLRLDGVDVAHTMVANGMARPIENWSWCE